MKIPFFDVGLFDLPEACTEDINEITKSFNPNEAPELDLIPLKIIPGNKAKGQISKQVFQENKVLLRLVIE